MTTLRIVAYGLIAFLVVAFVASLAWGRIRKKKDYEMRYRGKGRQY